MFPSLSATLPDLLIQLLPALNDACWNLHIVNLRIVCWSQQGNVHAQGVHHAVLLILPFPCHAQPLSHACCSTLDGVRYRTKKPMPAPNTFVSVEGFVTCIDVEDRTFAVGCIHILVNNLTFPRKVNISPPTRTPSSCHTCYRRVHTDHTGSCVVVCSRFLFSI